MTGRSERKPRRSLGARVEALESRKVLTASSTSYYQALAKYSYDHFTSELQRIELSSQATPAEFLALRDDTRSISEAVSAAPAASIELVAATVLIDRSLLDGSLDDAGWSSIRDRLGNDLASSSVAPVLLDHTVADTRAAAVSAGVSAGSAQSLLSDIANVQRARNWMHGGTPYASFHDPAVYYTQHLRGFFRGWAQQKTADQNRLRADLATTPHGPGGVLGRDVSILQQLGAPIPSTANGVLTDAYVNAFASLPPTQEALSAFRSTAIAEIGATATAPRVALVDRLVADAPAFATAAGNSQATIATIVADTRAVTDDGAGSSLNPFLIERFPGAVSGG